MSFDRHADRPDRVVDRLASLVADGKFNSDASQLAVAERLDRLISQIEKRRLSRKSSSLGWLFGSRESAPGPLKGLYIHGGVGRGKTMLMDWFYQALAVTGKRRAHFHDFMADVHERIHGHRQGFKAGETDREDPIPPVAEALAKEAWVLCFDEFSVSDITDAMILSRLFSSLFENGVLLVATSNIPPEDLYEDGLNRDLFLPFVTTLKQHVDVVPLDAERDYRMDDRSQSAVYLNAHDAASKAAMENLWQDRTGGKDGVSDEIKRKGRSIIVPRASDGSAWFSFADLCLAPLGAGDYLAIAKRFETVFVDSVPDLSSVGRNAVKRFILLIDTLYDHRRRLIISAEVEPDQLYREGNGTEGFEFARTASRLTEMRSSEYLASLEEASLPS